jgi:3-methyladenine DNA glycosylase/8-oxoguanine DNA glycosylase
VPTADVLLDGPLDLERTLSPLTHGRQDVRGRVRGDVAWLALRRRDGPVTVHLRKGADRVLAEAWGPGGTNLPDWLPDLLGMRPGIPSSGDLRDAPHRLIADLARRQPGIRIPATGAVLDALIPAIIGQKVTGQEAGRTWKGLIREHGEPAPEADAPEPDPAADGASITDPVVPILRLTPPPGVLARMPYYAYHPFGMERRRADVIRAVADRADWFEAVVDLSPADAEARLRSVPGVGPWTAAEVAVRALGDVDAVSVGDFHLPNLVAWALAREPRGDDARMLELLEPSAGRRALVMRLLEESGIRAPRYGPRLSPRRIEDL